MEYLACTWGGVVDASLRFELLLDWAVRYPMYVSLSDFYVCSTEGIRLELDSGLFLLLYPCSSTTLRAKC